MNALQGFGLFFLLGGAVGVCGGVERVFRKRAQIRRLVVVNARVVGVESDGAGEPGEAIWYHPVVTFVAGGKSVRARLPRGAVRQGEHRVSAAIRVYYDPRDPTQVAAHPRDFPGGWTATALGVLFAAIGAGLCWAGWGSGR